MHPVKLREYLCLLDEAIFTFTDRNTNIVKCWLFSKDWQQLLTFQINIVMYLSINMFKFDEHIFIY